MIGSPHGPTVPLVFGTAPWNPVSGMVHHHICSVSSHEAAVCRPSSWTTNNVSWTGACWVVMMTHNLYPPIDVFVMCLPEFGNGHEYCALVANSRGAVLGRGVGNAGHVGMLKGGTAKKPTSPLVMREMAFGIVGHCFPRFGKVRRSPTSAH